MSPQLPSLRPAFEALARARSRNTASRPHRALVRIEAGPYLVQALILPAVFCALLLRFEPWLVAFWSQFILSWAEVLDLPLRASARGAGWGEVRLVWSYFETESVLPSRLQFALHSLATVGLFAATFFMSPAKLPVKYALRVLCAVHGSALAFFAVSGLEFPYDIPDHILAMTGGGFVLLVTIPLMLAASYYVLRIPLATKIFNTALILLYFIVLIPLEAVIHAVLLRYLSALAMPLLFFGLGALFNFAIFIALYAWAASTARVEAAPSRA